jgi:hypothetical protein
VPYATPSAERMVSWERFVELPTSRPVLLRAFAGPGARGTAPGRRPAGRLIGGTAGRRRRDRACRRFVGRERDGGAVVRDFERVAPEQGVAGLPAVHLDPDAAPSEKETEGQAGEPPREPGCEAQ